MTQASKNVTNLPACQQEVLNQVEADLTVDGDLDISDYIGDAEADEKTIQNVQRWAAKQRETTRTKLAMRLANLFGGSLIASFVVMGAAAFNPNADKAFIKDIIPVIITPQSTLLAAALGYYFGTKDKD